MANNAKHPQITLLLTRPQRGSEAFWQALPDATRRQLILVVAPLMRIEPIANDLTDIGDVVFSSANGPLNSPHGDQRIAYCVGAQTCKAAQDAGWDARQLGNTADQLVEQLVKLAPRGPLSHLGGTHTRGDIAPRLCAAGIKTNHIAIYTQADQSLTNRANTILSEENPVIVPLFSPRTARRFAQQAKPNAPLHFIALSDAVASEIIGLNAKTVQICPEPTRDAMIMAVQNVTARIPLG